MNGAIEIGHEVPPLEIVVSGEQVREYVAAAKMPGTRFVSDEAARKEGLPGRILPGNMSLSLLARMVHEWLPEARIEKLGVTYRGLVFPEKPLRLTGFVTDRAEAEGGVRLECDLVLECDGERRVTGLAVLYVPDPATP